MRQRTFLTVAVSGLVGFAPLVAASTPVNAVGAASPSYGATWTVDTAGNAVHEYAPSASGAATPVASIAGSATGLSSPSGVAVASNGTVYVANAGSDSITIYSAGAVGNTSPRAIITGSKTLLDAPSSIALNDGLIWVTDPAADVVEGFAVGSRGNEIPAETMAGKKTQLNHPIAVSFDQPHSSGLLGLLGTGELMVLNAPTSGPATITSYAQNKPGDVAPVGVLAGTKKYPLIDPTAILAAGDDEVWVADASSNTVEKFYTFVLTRPLTAINGSSTGLDDPTGLSMDADGDLVVANAGNHTLRRFGLHAKGNAHPVESVSHVGATAGALTGIASFGAAPGHPINTVAVEHNLTVHLSWTAPTKTGGGIIGYRITVVQKGSVGSVVEAILGFSSLFGQPLGVNTTSTTFTKSKLKKGATYEFLVSAVNAFGESEPGNSAEASPFSHPGRPRDLTATSGHHSVTLRWSPPVHDGGTPIRSYRVAYSRYSKIVSGRRHQLTIRHLAPGQHYQFAVTARTKAWVSKAVDVTGTPRA